MNKVIYDLSLIYRPGRLARQWKNQDDDDLPTASISRTRWRVLLVSQRFTTGDVAQWPLTKSHSCSICLPEYRAVHLLALCYAASSMCWKMDRHDQGPDLYAFIEFIEFIGFIGPGVINYMCYILVIKY